MTRILAILASLLALLVTAGPLRLAPPVSAQPGPRPRVIVSTDIGGTDPDDFQSMVHFLLYADMFDVEGLVSSPYGPGRREHILQVIDHYERDYANLKTHSTAIPDARRACGRSPSRARSTAPGPAGFDTPTDGLQTGSSQCRAAQRSAAALRAGLGRHRRPRAGAARRARHPAETARLLHRRPEQDVERRRLQLHRAASSRRCG